MELKFICLLLLITMKDCVQTGHAARTSVQKNTKSSDRKLTRKPINRPTSEMVDNTIKNLKEQGRYSLHANKDT
jgi:hypothetical protein